MWVALLIIIIIWFAPTLIKRLLQWWVMRRLRRQYEQFARANGQSSSQSSDGNKSRKGGWEHADHKKKIAADEGEYVDYDEVTITIDESTTINTDTSSTTTHTHIEATELRVEDAEWEDL